MILTIWTTRACTLKCAYCYERDFEIPESAHMSVATADHIAEFAARSVPEHEHVLLNLHGGEPLLNLSAGFRLADSLSRECARNSVEFGVYVTTNGTVWDDQVERFLNVYRPDIALSIDGDCQVHDSQRRFGDGRGSYDKVVMTTMRLLSAGFNVTARMTVTPSSAYAVSEGVDHVAGLGFKTIKVIPDTGAYWAEEDVRVLDHEIDRLWARQSEYASAGIKVSVFEVYSRPLSPIGPCQVGEEYMNVDVDGTFYTCSFVVGRKEFSFGNARDGIDRTRLDELNLSSCAAKRTACEGCSLFAFCKTGRCTYINYSQSGDLGLPSAAECAVQRLLACPRG